MGQRSNYAAVKDAQIKLKKEECAKDMGQRSINVAVKDAQTMLKKEECALDMGQRSNYAAVKDAQIMPNMEECALGMEQRSNYAAVKDDAQKQNKLKKEGAKAKRLKLLICDRPFQRSPLFIDAIVLGPSTILPTATDFSVRASQGCIL